MEAMSHAPLTVLMPPDKVCVAVYVPVVFFQISPPLDRIARDSSSPLDTVSHFKTLSRCLYWLESHKQIPILLNKLQLNRKTSIL